MIRNYTKLSSLNLVLESVKGVIRSNTSFLFLFVDQIEDTRRTFQQIPSSFPLFHPVESKPLCESGRSRREETLQGHLGSRTALTIAHSSAIVSSPH